MLRDPDLPSIAVVMGVAGAGKTTVGERLARRLGWKFIEGDRLHSFENLAKMQSGRPLTDADRAPWLDAIAAVIDDCQRQGSRAVITCSALKRAYRRCLIGERRGIRLIFLDGSRELIGERLAARLGHFMPASLSESQFAVLEPPGADEDPITVSVDQPVDRVVDQIVVLLKAGRTRPRPQCFLG